jgi:hypothetical protein
LAGQFPASTRVSLLMGYTHVAMTHHYSILRLSLEGADGSVLALMRPLVETCLRGVWLHHVATDDQIERFVNRQPLNFPEWKRLIA